MRRRLASALRKAASRLDPPKRTINVTVSGPLFASYAEVERGREQGRGK